jgi:hypothetical protein
MKRDMHLAFSAVNVQYMIFVKIAAFIKQFANLPMISDQRCTSFFILLIKYVLNSANHESNRSLTDSRVQSKVAALAEAAILAPPIRQGLCIQIYQRRLQLGVW